VELTLLLFLRSFSSGSFVNDFFDVVKMRAQALADSSIKVSSQITGWGKFLPEKIIPNKYFCSYLETSEEWILSRTGIEERRWAEADVSASQIAEPACLEALSKAGLSAIDIDGIIVATVTPDYVFPSTACVLQNRLGVSRGFAFDINAVCSGFIYALANADALIKSGLAKNILVVGVDLYSRIINPKDRTTCVLFGDGAGAVVLSAVPSNQVAGTETAGVSGIYGAELGADGSQANILCVPLGTANPQTLESMAEGQHFLQMQGKEVFKYAVRKLGEINASILDRFGFESTDVDFFISHQANKRILTSMIEHMQIPEGKVLINLEKYGNTSAASVPILLSESADSGKIKKGNLLVLSAFGGGVTWGAILLRW
jgi:3-oxoacyl-[acyl-carrier-protein] synthase III